MESQLLSAGCRPSEDPATAEAPLAAAEQAPQPHEPHEQLDTSELGMLHTAPGIGRLRPRRDLAAARRADLLVASSPTPETSIVQGDGDQHADAMACADDGSGSDRECLNSEDALALGQKAAQASHRAQARKDASRLHPKRVRADASEPGYAQLATNAADVGNSVTASGDARDDGAAGPAQQQDDTAVAAVAFADGNLHADTRWAAQLLKVPHCQHGLPWAHAQDREQSASVFPLCRMRCR